MTETKRKTEPQPSTRFRKPVTGGSHEDGCGKITTQGYTGCAPQLPVTERSEVTLGGAFTVDRRTFLKSACLGAAALKGASVLTASGMTTQVSSAQSLERLNPRNVKLNVKPVFGALVHSGMWEGPCRWGVQKTPDQERADGRARYSKAVEETRKRLTGDVRLLEPVYHEYSDKMEATIGQDLFDKLARDSDDTDLYLVYGAYTFGQYCCGVVGRRFRKPTAMLGNLVNMEAAAYLRSIGVEGYAPVDYEELNGLISVLRARKVFQQTSIVYPTDLGRRLKRNVSCVSDFEDLKSRFGITTTIVPYKELASEVNGVERDDARARLAEEITDRLVAASQKCDIDRKYVLSDVRFSLAVRSLMAKHNSNSCTIECMEFCANRLAQDWKACPCLHHSLMKSEGYASACEGDINALLSMQMLMAISKKAAYMGNLNPKDKEHVLLGHEVPAVKMNGFDAPDLPYELRNFVVSGWGTKMQIELDKVGEKTATFARIDPTAKKILIAKGEVVGCEGFRKPGCALVAVLRVPDARELLRRRVDYGFHFAMVYGDYAQQMADLSRLLRLEVSTFNV